MKDSLEVEWVRLMEDQENVLDWEYVSYVYAAKESLSISPKLVQFCEAWVWKQELRGDNGVSDCRGTVGNF